MLSKQLTSFQMIHENRAVPPSAFPTSHTWRCVVECMSPFSENGTKTYKQKLSDARVLTRTHTHSNTHIYAYTQTKYMASNVESRQLNKWHFLLCFFFSWYRHNQTWCSSSTLVLGRYNEYNVLPYFFHRLFTHWCKIDQRSKTLTPLLVWTVWRCVFFCYDSLYGEKKITFKTLLNA